MIVILFTLFFKHNTLESIPCTEYHAMAGVITQWLKVLLQRTRTKFPAPTQWLKAACNCRFKGFDALFWPLQASSLRYTYTQDTRARMHTHLYLYIVEAPNMKHIYNFKYI